MMRILLDTHVSIWAAIDSWKLRREAREAMLAADEVHVSAASIWEIVIKARLGKIDCDPSRMADAIAASGFLALPVTPADAATVARLPDCHSDPFDRLLIAQAIGEPLLLFTSDDALPKYSSELVRRI